MSFRSVNKNVPYVHTILSVLQGRHLEAKTLSSEPHNALKVSIRSINEKMFPMYIIVVFYRDTILKPKDLVGNNMIP